MKKIKAVL